MLLVTDRCQWLSLQVFSARVRIYVSTYSQPHPCRISSWPQLDVVLSVTGLACIWACPFTPWRVPQTWPKPVLLPSTWPNWRCHEHAQTCLDVAPYVTKPCDVLLHVTELTVSWACPVVAGCCPWRDQNLRCSHPRGRVVYIYEY